MITISNIINIITVNNICIISMITCNIIISCNSITTIMHISAGGRLGEDSLALSPTSILIALLHCYHDDDDYYHEVHYHYYHYHYDYHYYDYYHY